MRLVLTAAVLAAGLVAPAGASAATVWVLPYPFSTNLSDPGASDITLRGPKTSFRGVGPMSSYAAFS